MCLIALAWKVHPHWPLVLAANRDEYHARPTAPLAQWQDAPEIYGGRDLQAGGGWLALNPSRQRLAAVTNFREPVINSGAHSRGALVQNFTASTDPAAAFAALLAAEASAYGPFNLLLFDGTELIYTSNRPAPRWEVVPPGLHGLSNGSLELHWPKVQRLTAALQHWLRAAPVSTSLPSPDTVEPLLQALRDERIANDAELPDTGVGIDMERMLSPPFIRGDTYGTRASSVLMIARDGTALFVERRFGPGGIELGSGALELRADPPR